MSAPVPRKTSSGDAPAEIAGDLHRTLGHSLDYTVREWRRQLAAIERQQQGYVPPGDKRDDLAALRDFTRSAIDSFAKIRERGAGRLDHLRPDEVSWHDLTSEWTRDGDAGRALWGTVATTARTELAHGTTAARAIEGYSPRPIERAQFLAIREALADGLQPRNGMEGVLIDGMAEAWTLHLRWLSVHSKLDSLEAIRVERDVRQRDGWEPPRLSDVAAVDRAAQMADRFQRQFLRLMKCYREQRRVLGPVIVAAGGQLNVGQQQVNVGTVPEPEAS